MKKMWGLILLVIMFFLAWPVQSYAADNQISFENHRIKYQIVKDPHAALNSFGLDDDGQNDDKHKNAGYLILDVKQAGDEYDKGEDMDDYDFDVYDGEVKLSSIDDYDFDDYINKKYHPTKKMPKLKKGVYSKARFIYRISPSDDIKIKAKGVTTVLNTAKSSDGIFTDDPVVAGEGTNE